ncbi:hypothetical protein, partial [Denitratisoma oestradiolicum]|uniref:hypothetical protein n=1 Tax=Denitratisoma oestradiolicum TaxID=311182 RepID=UPI001E487A32
MMIASLAMARLLSGRVKVLLLLCCNIHHTTEQHNNDGERVGRLGSSIHQVGRRYRAPLKGQDESHAIDEAPAGKRPV